jgi:hypothetical protein
MPSSRNARERFDIVAAALLDDLQPQRKCSATAEPSGTTDPRIVAPWLPPVTRIFQRRALVEGREGKFAKPHHFLTHRIADHTVFGRCDFFNRSISP